VETLKLSKSLLYFEMFSKVSNKNYKKLLLMVVP
jgi:hypothetical protein